MGVRIHPSIHPLVSKSNSHTMSFLKQLEEKKNALKKAEVSRKETTGPQEMIMKETEDNYRMMKETYFEAYYDQIEDFTFKSVILHMTIDDTKALMEEHAKFMDGTDKDVDLSVVDAKINEGITLIREKVKSFVKVFTKAMESVLDSFVMDIVIDDAGKVWVVEVNPFGEMAGSCLFEWSRDRAILMGRQPFQFRIVDQPPPLGLIKTEVDPRVLEVLGIQ